MAGSFVRTLFSGAQASATSYACVLTASMAAGNHAVIGVGTANARTLGTITDSRGGNSYGLDDEQNAANGTHNASGKPANALQSGDTVTIPITGGSSSGWVIIEEWTGLATAGWFDKAAHAIGASAGSGGSGSTAALAQADSVVIGFWSGNAPASTSYTPNAGEGWTTGEVASGTREGRAFYKVVNSTAAVAFDAAWAPNTAWGMAVVVYKAAPTAVIRTPDAGVITASGPVPRGIERALAPAAVTTISGPLPKGIERALTPTGIATISGPVPKGIERAAPAAGQLTAQGPGPLARMIAKPPPGVLSFSGPVPTVQFSGGALIRAPSSGVISASAPAPAIRWVARAAPGILTFLVPIPSIGAAGGQPSGTIAGARPSAAIAGGRSSATLVRSRESAGVTTGRAGAVLVATRPQGDLSDG
jgi:hypothetical protein